MSTPSEPTPQFGDTIQNLLAFLRRPRLPQAFQKQSRFAVFFHLLGLSLLLSMSSLLLLGALQKWGLVPELPHAMEEVMKEFPFIVVLLLAAVVMPALEEFAFRLWLVPGLLYVGLSLWLVAFFLYSALFQVGFVIAGYAVLGFASLMTIALMSFRQAAVQILERLYQNHFGWVLYGATALFALVHLINFKPGLEILLLAPILVLPQFLLGLVLAYIRVKLGMGWAIALHGVYNGLVLSMAYTGMQAEAAETASSMLRIF